MAFELTTATLLLVIGVAVWYILDQLYVPSQLPNEPPLVSHPIPYIGHFIGLLRYGTRYYEMTRYNTYLPEAVRLLHPF